MLGVFLWVPTHTQTQEFNLSLGQSSGASVIPWVAGAVTGNMAGWGADALVNKASAGQRYNSAEFLVKRLL